MLSAWSMNPKRARPDGLWQTADLVFVVDAVVDGKGVRAIHRFEIGPSTGCDEVIPADSHFLCASGLAGRHPPRLKSSDMPPARLIVYGIEAECFKPGEGLSLDVLAAAEQVTREILHYIGLRHSGSTLYASIHGELA